MKLILNSQLKAEFLIDSSSTERDIADSAADFADIAEVCNKFSVAHEIILGTEIGSSTKFTIYAQKITLESDCVNEFLHSVLYLFDYTLDYLPRGIGCDLALEIIEKKL